MHSLEKKLFFCRLLTQILFMIYKSCVQQQLNARRWKIFGRCNFLPSFYLPTSGFEKKKNTGHLVLATDAMCKHAGHQMLNSPFVVSREKHLQFFYTCSADFLVSQSSRNQSLLSSLHGLHAFFDGALDSHIISWSILKDNRRIGASECQRVCLVLYSDNSPMKIWIVIVTRFDGKKIPSQWIFW